MPSAALLAHFVPWLSCACPGSAVQARLSCVARARPAGGREIAFKTAPAFCAYFPAPEDLSVLAAWRSSLRQGGVLVMEMADMDRARSRIPADGRLVRETNGVTEFLSMDWTTSLLTVEYRFRGESWSCVTRLYEKDHLREDLLKAGFSTVDLYGSFTFSPKREDDNLIVIAVN